MSAQIRTIIDPQEAPVLFLPSMGNSLRTERYRNLKLLVIGLDSAGKSTILYRLQLGEVISTVPTIGFNIEVIEHKSMKISSWVGTLSFP